MAKGRRRLSAVNLSVPQLLNEAQRGAASAQVRYAKMLWDLATSDAQATRDQLLVAMKWFMTVAEPTVYQSRLLSFFATFSSETNSEDRTTFIECILDDLVELSYAKDHTARWRVCQLLHSFFANLPPEVELSDELLDAFQEAMLERLEDSKPNIKAVAVRALARLPDPGDAGDFAECELTRTLLDMLGSEKSKAVRKAVLATLPKCELTRKCFMERTRDEADDVRKVAYIALAERVPLSETPVEDAALLIRRGLTDRAAVVRDAVANKLVLTWLDECEGEPLRLIHVLNVQANPEECELVLRTLLEQGTVNAVHLGRLAESDSIGLRGDFSQPGTLMGPASALFWRVVCEWLHSQATSRGLAAANKVGAAANIDAAAAAERLEALEAAMPPTVAEMADVIAKHAAAGAQYRFSTGQLMLLAAKCMDFADAAGRSAASLMLRQLLTDVPSADNAAEAAAWEAAWHSESWLQALALFLRKVYGSPAELADAMLDIMGSLHRLAGFGTQGMAVAEQAWVHALGVAGLMLEQLPSARPALAASSTFSLRDLLDNIIQPGLRNPSAKVRREAVRCLGLYCFLDGIPTSPSSHLLVLRQVLITPGESSAVKAVAAQALGDIAVAHGVKLVDRYLAEELAQGLVPGLDPELQQKPLVDMLLDVLHQWAEDFAAAAAAGAKKKSVRRSRSGEGLEQQAALGAAVVESLARLVRSHLRWQARQEQEGKLLAMEDLEVVKVLVDLVLLYFNPGIEAATLVCQALPVFFQNYAALTSEHQQFLATAFLPAARMAAAEDKVCGKRITAATCTSSKVMGFLAQLLMTPYGPAGKQEAVGHEMLVDILLREILVCSGMLVPKPYLATLCKVAATLEVFPVGETEGGVPLRCLRELAHQALPMVPDRAMRKDLDVLLDKLRARAKQHQLNSEAMSPEEINMLLDTIRDYDGEESCLAEFPLPFDAMAEPPAAGGRAGKTPAKTPARGGRRQQVAADSSDDDSDAGPQMPPSDDEDDEDAEKTPARVPPTASRRMPERAARSARKPVVDAATSSSDEEEDEEDGSNDDEGAEAADGLSPLNENVSPAVVRPTKARRLSSDSVSALRQALQENRIS